MYFFFDIDGTLTDNRTKQIVPSAKEALKQLAQNGHFVAIATGRAHYKAVDDMHRIGAVNMVCNGGNGLVVNDTFVQNIPLDRDKCLELIKELEAKEIGFMVADEDDITIKSKDYRFLQQTGPRQEPTIHIIDPDYDYTKIEHFYKIYVAVTKEEEYKIDNLDIMGHLRFAGDYLMYQPDNKGGGIDLMLKEIGGKREDVVVFGDDYNDLVMFQDDFTCIAMGNACDELKAKADFVTKANVDDGIEYALKHYRWI